MLLEVGERVAGRFVVDHLVAEGGLSEVYQVRHIELGSVHALKLLRADHPGITKRLLMEGRIQAQLTHPNIAPVTDVVRHKDRVGLLMPLILGKSMAELLERRVQIPVAESLELMAGVLCGVSAAHGAGVLHRDIKPGNVLLLVEGEAMRPLVTDFGIAKVAESMGNATRVGSAMGTPGYSAPEQVLDAADVDVRADIFSLGVVLYRMLTGRMPYVSPDGSVRIGSVVSEPYTPLGVADATLPDALCETVDKALARSAQDRFADVHEMAKALLKERPKLLARVLAPSGIGPISFELPTLDPVPDGPESGAPGVTLMPEAAEQPAPTPNLAFAPAPTEPESPAPLPAAEEKSPLIWLGAAAAVLLLGGGLWWWQGEDPVTEPLAENTPEEQQVIDQAVALKPISTPSPEEPPAEPVEEEVLLGAPSELGEPVVVGPGPSGVESSGIKPAGEKPVEAVPEGPDQEVPEEPSAETVASDGPDVVEPEEGEDVVAVVDPAEAPGSITEAPPVPEEPEQPPTWSGPDVSGAWSGTAGGRPATMLLKMTPEGQVTGELVFILGATRRSFPVRGSVDEQGRMKLSSGSDLSLSAQASEASINGSYEQGRSKGQSIRLGR